MEFEFNLDAPIENLDGVPTQYHAYFEQGEGGYSVSDSFKPVAKQINGLSGHLKKARSSLTKANGEAAERRVSLTGFDEIFDDLGDELSEKTPAQLKKYLAGLKAKAAKGGAAGEEAAQQLENAKRAMADAHQKEISGVRETLTAAEGTIKKLLVDNRVSGAISEASGNPKLLSPMIRGECEVRTTEEGERVVVIIGDNGQPRYNGAGDLLSIEERVSELKADPAFQAAFTGQVKGGADTKTTTVVTKSKGGFDHSKANGRSLIKEGLRKQRAGIR